MLASFNNCFLVVAFFGEDIYFKSLQCIRLIVFDIYLSIKDCPRIANELMFYLQLCYSLFAYFYLARIANRACMSSSEMWVKCIKVVVKVCSIYSTMPKSWHKTSLEYNISVIPTCKTFPLGTRNCTDIPSYEKIRRLTKHILCACSYIGNYRLLPCLVRHFIFNFPTGLK